jgi:D-alanyl-D-alanine carboxypeptidase
VAGTSDLDPQFKVAAEAWFSWLKNADRRYVVTSGRRTRTEQEALYARFQRDKSAGRPVYTTLPPGRSLHERGLAVDLVRFGVDAHTDPDLRRIGLLWRKLGGTWGGDADPVHFGAPRSWW